ncbi:BnaAnng13070D [Brassica napus]|uniref:BnaAnng13070D protein n=1 Tax=Brassica napus TaxID=3708 RepID=A0A078IWK6_BRANA|nr:BnaAnng13070D [Brassica napus]
MGSETMRKLVDLPVLHKFMLYRTLTNFYLIGRDKKKTFWRILKIDRTDPNELNLFEDPTRYTHEQIVQLKKWISRGNQEYGGLRAETTCYGIIGFVKFLGPYYMLVIKKRKKVGEICGHTVYGVVDSQMIMIPYHSGETRVAGSAAEQRYKKLLNMVDLSKNFYFSYTYHLMYSLQKNICNTERGKIHDETMFVWNKYLTHGIRRILQNTVWTVSLTKCLVSDEEFILTVIARRSRHYAGTRYLRRGVNDEGSVANEMRGSIPLFCTICIFSIGSLDGNYVATQHHFENLKQRYGKLIIILNLLKKGKHRENILLEEFRKSIWFINGCMKENYLEAIHFDLHEHYKSGADAAFGYLCAYAKRALGLINLFFCEAPSVLILMLPLSSNPIPNQDEEAISSEEEALKADIFMLQKGVLRGPPVVDMNNPLAEKLMEAYEKMGHVIAMQYAGSDAHTKMFSALRGDWNMMMKHHDMLTAVHRYYNNAYNDSEKQDAINVFLGKFKPQLRRPALWDLRSDQRNTKRSNLNLDIENLRSKLTRSFSDNLLLEGLDPKKLVLENPQPSREGLNGGWETTSEFGFYEEDSSSPSVHSAIRDEDHMRGTESRQMFPGSSSTSDSRWLDDVPGFSHSYNAKFTTADEMFERSSSMSSDNMFSDMYKSFTSTTGTDHPSDADQPADGIVLVPSFSIDFIQWVEHGRALERVRR